MQLPCAKGKTGELSATSLATEWNWRVEEVLERLTWNVGSQVGGAGLIVMI